MERNKTKRKLITQSKRWKAISEGEQGRQRGQGRASGDSDVIREQSSSRAGGHQTSTVSSLLYRITRKSWKVPNTLV